MAIYLNEINVRDYGAVGDGQTNDSPAFDAALLAMKNEGTSRGNKLIIPSGTFRLTHELFIDCNCIIEGSGFGSGTPKESAGTLLLFSPEAVTGKRIGNHGIVVTASRGSSSGRNADWTVIRDLTIQAFNMDLPGRHGIILRARAKIENVVVLSFTGNGIHIVTGNGDNSDGNTIWKPGEQYTVGDYVMEPGFPRHLLTSRVGSISAMFNPQKSNDVTNTYTLKITRNDAAWDNLPVAGDTFVIPVDSGLAGSVLTGNPPIIEKPNAGAYIVLGSAENVPEPNFYSFWVEKYADDPYVPSNRMRKNPVSVGETRLNYINTGVGGIGQLPTTVRGLESNATASILNNVDHETYLVLTNPIGTFKQGEVIQFENGNNATALDTQYSGVDILSLKDLQIFSRPQNRYGLTKTGNSSTTGEGPGEVRLNYYNSSNAGNHAEGKVTGSTSGATADVVRDSGLYIAITNSTKAFLKDEVLTFLGGVGGTANSGKITIGYKMDEGMRGGPFVGATISTTKNGDVLTAFVTADDGSVFALTPIPPANTNIFEKGDRLTLSLPGERDQSAVVNSDQVTIAGTQYHSTTPGYMALNYTSATAGTHVGDTVTSGIDTNVIEGIIGYDNGTTIIFHTISKNRIRSGEELTFTKPQTFTGTTTRGIAINDQVPAPGLSDGPSGTTQWFSQGHDMGNANNWLVEYCRVAECGGHGMFIDGDNVNAGVSIDFDASVNGGLGIYDNSFLGNTHIGAHVAANKRGAYRTSQHGNAHNTFIGCYSEGDYSPPSKIYTPSISLGGLMAAGFANDSSGFRLDGSSMTPHATTVHEPLNKNDIRLNFKDYAGASDVSRGDIVTQTQVDSSTLPPTIVNLSATVEWISKQKDNIQIAGINPTGAIFKDGLDLIFTRNGSRIGTATAKGTQHPANKATTTITAYQGGGGVPISGLQIVNTDDYLGISLGSYNREIDSWEFGRVNYPPSFEVLGGVYKNIFRPSSGIVIPAGRGTDSGIQPGVFILATNGYPLLGELSSNSFYPGTLILNQNVEKDGIKGWICTHKCGSGRAWTKWEDIRDPYYAGATITPSILTAGGLVYRAAIAGPAIGGEYEPVWPTTLGETVQDGGMTWECFGYTDKGLEEIVTREIRTTQFIPSGTSITSGEDHDITGKQFQKFGLIKIIKGSSGVKFPILKPNSNSVSYYVQCTIQTFGSGINSVVASTEDEPGNTGHLIATIIGNSIATDDTLIAWLLKWS
jgi:Pectate lyase superfamily protein